MIDLATVSASVAGRFESRPRPRKRAATARWAFKNDDGLPKRSTVYQDDDDLVTVVFRWLERDGNEEDAVIDRPGNGGLWPCRYSAKSPADHPSGYSAFIDSD